MDTFKFGDDNVISLPLSSFLDGEWGIGSYVEEGKLSVF
jgi:hypothetical protein